MWSTSKPGKPSLRWLDNVENDLSKLEVKGNDRKDCVSDVNDTKVLRELYSKEVSNSVCIEKILFNVSWNHVCTIIILKQKTNKNLVWDILYFVLFHNFLSKYLYFTYLNTNIWSNIHSYSQNKYCPSVSNT